MAAKVIWRMWLLIVLLVIPACARAENGVGAQVNPALPSAPPRPTRTPASPARASETPTTRPPSPTPEPTPTPAPVLRQLTTGGCCAGPFWSPDSAQVLFIDRPAPDAPAGLWAVDMRGGEPVPVTERLGVYSEDMAYLAYPDNGVTVIERAADGVRWNLANGGRAVAFSPDNTLLAWTAGQSGPPFDTARRVVWVSASDGSQARPVAEVFGGSLIAWLPDRRLLISGRLDVQDPETSLWAVDWELGQWIEILRSEQRLRGTLISPEGSWLAYQVLFSAQEGNNGLWVVDLSTGERRQLTLFGAYRWGSEGRLYVIPLDITESVHQLWEIQVKTGEASPLTDRTVTPFRIANGDWTVSPDGRHMVFISAADYNIWVIDLPDGV